MADIFWGVSDALDLYSEYLSVQKTKTQTIEESLKVTPNCGVKTITTENAANGDCNNGRDAEKALVAMDTSKPTEFELSVKENSDSTDVEKLERSNLNTNSAEHVPNNTVTEHNDVESFVDIKKKGAGDGPSTASDDSNTFDSSQNVLGAVRHEGGEETKTINNLNIGDNSNCGKNFNPITAPSVDIFCPDEDEAKPDEECNNIPDNAPQVIKILIFGGGDPRHIIKTMAKRYTHCKNEGNASCTPILKFYMVDGCIEIIARNIALLGIALERPELISLRNKVHLFMDVYGNSMLRPICHQYLVSKATTLLKMVTDNAVLNEIAPFINIDSLKYRERDNLQDAFEFWHPKPGYDFVIQDYWMSRLRRLLAVRYDAREGVFDWDLNMSLKNRGAQQICSQEYRYWRETGIAFTFPEYEQCKPNKTFAAGLVRNGGRFLHRGYIGDIQTGPFCTFGLRSIEERLHRSQHGENDYRATEVTERNLLEYFHEIQNGTPYVHNEEVSHKYGGVRFQMGEILTHNEYESKSISAYDQPWISVEGIEVNFLSLNEVKPIGKGASKWENFFDVAFVGYKYFEFLEDAFPNVLRENALLILETKLRSVEIKNRISEFESELQNYARDAKLTKVVNYNVLNTQNSILKYWKAEKSAQENL